MITTSFIGGILVGAIVGFLLLFFTIIFALRLLSRDGKERWKETDKFNAITIELMRERNKIDAEQARHLKALAAWTENNWQR